MAADYSGAVGGFEDGSEHSKGGGFAGAVGAEEAVNLAGLAGEADVIDGADFTALLVLEAFGQAASFDHRGTLAGSSQDRSRSADSVLRGEFGNVTGTERD